MDTGEKAFAKFVSHGSLMHPQMEYVRGLLQNAKKSSHYISTSSSLGDYVFVEDGGIFNLHLFQENWRGPLQYLRGEVLDQPDSEFVSTMADWSEHDVVRIYFSNPSSGNELAAKYGVKAIEKSLIVLHNKAKGKIAYATQISLKDFDSLWSNYATSQYNSGFSSG